MHDLLFAYGTLRNETIRELVLGQKVEGKPDGVQRFRLETLQYGDIRYPVLVADSNLSDLIEGTVFAVTAEDLERLDRYEGPCYQRTVVQLVSGRMAWMYEKAEAEHIATGS